MVRTTADRRVLITGAARGIGAALARRLSARGARVALCGLEPRKLAAVAGECAAPWRECDVADRAAVERVVEELASELGGLDVVVANAGIARQLALVGGDPEVFERILRVNTLGTYYTLRAAGPHVSHRRGYALAVASLAAAIQLPLLGAYSASKAAVEALGNTLRAELAPSGARVGVAYFSELDTDMTSRGFATRAATVLTGGGTMTGVAPLAGAVRALERGIARRARRVVSPRWVAPLLPLRMAVQPVVERRAQARVAEALEIARVEEARYTTPQPGPVE
jgi:NAD(P)-dependent dehydrogenase (short-subunit alcohol dehydrogenase family)